jgi:predicted MFS family arabinose efflux permease
MIFSLPFHTARFFRPTFLDVFGFSNTELGDMFAVYGITAMVAYFPGGVIADRFSGRKLLTLSMLLTALGGFYMATIPTGISMALLYGYWGVTTILLFWAAVLKATRDWAEICRKVKHSVFSTVAVGSSPPPSQFLQLPSWQACCRLTLRLRRVQSKDQRFAVSFFCIRLPRHWSA